MFIYESQLHLSACCEYWWKHHGSSAQTFTLSTSFQGLNISSLLQQCPWWGIIARAAQIYHHSGKKLGCTFQWHPRKEVVLFPTWRGGTCILKTIQNVRKGTKAVNEPNTLTLQIRKLRPERPYMSQIVKVNPVSSEVCTSVHTSLSFYMFNAFIYLGWEWGGDRKVLRVKKNTAMGGFPGGTVVKNPPANAGDTGLSPGLGRSHMPRSNWACASQLLSLRCRACEPQLLKPARLEPVLCNKRSHRNEKPAQHNEE